MNFTWSLHSTMAATKENARLGERTLERVLLEYDGPQLTVTRAGAQQYLEYVADEIVGGMRWLQVKVSGVELRALHQGELSLREALHKSELVIFDAAHSGEIGGVWISPPASLPEECLPDAGVTLPGYARDPVVAAPRQTLAFECEGEGIRGHTISFRCLSAITEGLQRLWLALAKRAGNDVTGEWSAATLGFPAGAIGSFAIEVVPTDQTVFDEIARRYGELVRASYRNPKEVRARLAHDQGLAAAYGSYARALTQFKVDVFANGRHGGAFLGRDRAKSFTRYSRSARVPRAPSEPTPTIETVTVTGYFDGFMRNQRRFELFDHADGTKYAGEVEGEAIEDLRGMEIVVDPGVAYTAEIEISREGEQDPVYRLVAVRSGIKAE